MTIQFDEAWLLKAEQIEAEANCDIQAGLGEFQHKPMVMVVDDSPSTQLILDTDLSEAGYRVEIAQDGFEALEKLHSGLHYDLVILDIMMPRMDGLEMLGQLQSDPDLHDLPVAMLTANETLRDKAIDLGAKAYFTKPFDRQELLDCAERIINGEVLVQA
jgi:CheY-like chemotaxis protein